MTERSRLVRMHLVNIGCVGPEGLTIELDNIVCLVGENNTGKSTVLRAYELALGTERFSSDRDLNNRADKPVAYVELWVHIPKGIMNIAEKWKVEEDGLLLVRSRWEWAESNGWGTNRQTWNPEMDDYSMDDKASGLDPVFTSRLPKPFRIGTLEDPRGEHLKFLTLILQPVADRLKVSLEDEESTLSRALAGFVAEVQVPVKEESDKLDSLKEDLNRSHNAIFPDLQIDFEIGLGDIPIDPIKLLLRSSHIKFLEWAKEIDWSQQGTGSQRALFWTMLQVRSKLNTIAEITHQTTKKIGEGEKQIKKLRKEAEKAKKSETKQKKEGEVKEIKEQLEQLKTKEPEKLLEEREAELALPGYMLLIDEPEVALHPNAIRAASSYLYGLSDDTAWQIMLTTQSPQFIDPLKDHTTIVRLDRAENNPTPRTFRSDSANFNDDEKDNLKMLNRFDADLAQMFFGQYPILIEGDTEFAAFKHIMNTDPDRFPLHNRPVLVRARGKYSLRLLVRMLRHLRVGFSILHDSDCPKRIDGARNSAWTANEDLIREIQAARGSGIHVIHRVSVPTFELAHLPFDLSEDGSLKEQSSDNKPWRMVKAIKSSSGIRESIMGVLIDLLDEVGKEGAFDKDFAQGLVDALHEWVDTHSIRDDRFSLDD